MTQLEQQEGGLESWLKAATTAGLLQIPDLKLAATQFWGLFKAFSFWPKVFHLATLRCAATTNYQQRRGDVSGAVSTPTATLKKAAVILRLSRL